MNTATISPSPQEVYEFHQGTAPLLVSMPHVGTCLPDDLRPRLSEAALALPDTDWHLPLLYDLVRDLGASVLQARFSRYVVDLNRPPDDANLYPGQDTTGLCPVDTFDRQPLYQPGLAPTPQEIAERRTLYWQPYHDRLAQTLAQLRQQHPCVVLWDAHSIASVVPRFFEGRLPDLNLGTASGSSCSPALAEQLRELAAQSGYSSVLNGRFKGGYITRHYGHPDQGIQAVQLEMTQRCYMNEAAPFAYRADLAEQVRPVLKALLQASIDFARRGAP